MYVYVCRIYTDTYRETLSSPYIDIFNTLLFITFSDYCIYIFIIICE